VKRVVVEKVPGAIWMKTGFILGARIKRTLLEPDCEKMRQGLMSLTLPMAACGCLG